MSTELPRHQTAANTGWTSQRGTSAWGFGQVTPESFVFDQTGGDRRHNWFSSGLPTPPDTKAMTGVALNHNRNDDSAPLSYHQSRYQVHDVSSAGISTKYRSNSQPDIISRSKTDMPNLGHREKESRDAGYNSQPTSEDAIASYLQIPGSVNKSKGSLAEFAAEITCLFWFENAATLQNAENSDGGAYFDHGLLPDATPSTGFRKWVTTILSTTQVSKEVVLLALMFIHRLKKFNPTVSGKRGSEFRLLTIALMLGNKFLDDNTYTNKTWAEVSGISVMEIHIMEVEFLSNMRYDLYVSASEWKAWNTKLGQFGAFYERASKMSTRNEVRSSAPVTPISQTFGHKLPSPPATHHSSAACPPQSYSNTSLTNPLSTLPQLPRSPVHQQRRSVLEHLERKRSVDHSNEFPPAKRLHQLPPSTSAHASMTLTPTASAYTSSTLPSLTPDSSASGSHLPLHNSSLAQLPRLPMPNTQITNNHIHSHLAPLSLPPNRAMSTVYPHTSTNWTLPVTPVSAGPTMSMSLYQNPTSNLADNARPHSNYASANASPSSLAYNSLVNRPGLSPSFFLTNRSSPYRPVRSVNTLLIPPPSASLLNPAREIGHDQIHYQPLSKAGTERRTGPVPYITHDWHHSNQLTPLVLQQYPYRT